jgi:hypothetical protein
MEYNTWWLGNEYGHGNFGDILTPFILNHYGIKYKYTQTYANANLICVGSIARRANRNTTVLGSGIIRGNEILAAQANWKFVRGPHTRQRILSLGGSCPEIYGDPALLLPRIYNPIVEKTIDVGYVPHNVDHDITAFSLTTALNSPLATKNERLVRPPTNSRNTVGSALGALSPVSH